jgi:hypothetical protein
MIAFLANAAGDAAKIAALTPTSKSSLRIMKHDSIHREPSA